MSLDIRHDARLSALRDRRNYLCGRLGRHEGNVHYQKEEVRALDWALRVIQTAEQSGVLRELEADDAR